MSVPDGRCQHRGVLLGNGHIEDWNLICGVHCRDYRYDTGISECDRCDIEDHGVEDHKSDADAQVPKLAPDQQIRSAIT